ncbi:MAG: hypothetical protein Q7T20_16290 [Saprospiraceae bacterium]|nr:hypothetical protein [Saprospiraceae bacterium]
MNFEKISNKKFAAFKQSEVVNPILISGGWTDTDAGGDHDRFQATGAVTDYQQTGDGSTFTQDQQTSNDSGDTNNGPGY